MLFGESKARLPVPWIVIEASRNLESRQGDSGSGPEARGTSPAASFAKLRNEYCGRAAFAPQPEPLLVRSRPGAPRSLPEKPRVTVSAWNVP
jgi:hypothetical protein